MHLYWPLKIEAFSLLRNRQSFFLTNALAETLLCYANVFSVLNRTPFREKDICTRNLRSCPSIVSWDCVCGVRIKCFIRMLHAVLEKSIITSNLRRVLDETPVALGTVRASKVVLP